jgi:hypothetical protein
MSTCPRCNQEVEQIVNAPFGIWYSEVVCLDCYDDLEIIDEWERLHAEGERLSLELDRAYEPSAMSMSAAGAGGEE